MRTPSSSSPLPSPTRLFPDIPSPSSCLFLLTLHLLSPAPILSPSPSSSTFHSSSSHPPSPSTSSYMPSSQAIISQQWNSDAVQRACWDSMNYGHDHHQQALQPTFQKKQSVQTLLLSLLSSYSLPDFSSNYYFCLSFLLPTSYGICFTFFSDIDQMRLQ